MGAGVGGVGGGGAGGGTSADVAAIDAALAARGASAAQAFAATVAAGGPGGAASSGGADVAGAGLGGPTSGGYASEFGSGFAGLPSSAGFTATIGGIGGVPGLPAPGGGVAAGPNTGRVTYNQIIAQAAERQAALYALAHQKFPVIPASPGPVIGGRRGGGGGVATPPSPPPPVIIPQPTPPPVVVSRPPPVVVIPPPVAPPLIVPTLPGQPVTPPINMIPVQLPPTVANQPGVVPPSATPPALNLLHVPPAQLNDVGQMTRIIAAQRAGAIPPPATPAPSPTINVTNAGELQQFFRQIEQRLIDALPAEERDAVEILLRAQQLVQAGVSQALQLPRQIGQRIASAVNNLTNQLRAQPLEGVSYAPQPFEIQQPLEVQPDGFFNRKPPPPPPPPPQPGAQQPPPPPPRRPGFFDRNKPLPIQHGQPTFQLPTNGHVEPAPQTGDCTTPDSPLGQLARQLWNCPTFQQELRDKLTVTQQPGKPPQLGFKEPVCLCCASDEDLKIYAATGGINGDCVLTRGIGANELRDSLMTTNETMYGS